MEKKISNLESRIKIYSWIGWIFVILAIAPIIYAGYVVISRNGSWKEEDLGSFLGGVSGTFAALAGVFFVFVAFLGQRISIIQQQIELQDNRKELQETRKEIQGQKEQMELQNTQFQIQSFENVYFNLVKLFEKQSKLAFSKDYGDFPLIKKVEIFYSEMKVRILDPEWIKDNNSSKHEIIQDIFDVSFSEGFARVRTLIGAAISVLFHLERNRELIDHENYLTLFYNCLNVHEERVLFYGFFSSKIHLNSNQRKLYLEFLKIFYSAHMLHNQDKKLLPEF